VNPPVRVKICGITNYDDAAAAIDAGADALGFNLFAGSKRHVLFEDLISWLPSIAQSALQVAVMVNPTLEEIHRVQPFFDVIQLHGQESLALCAGAAANGRLWKAFPLTASLNAAEAAMVQAHALVIDSAVPGAFGGTGVLIDIDRAALFVRDSLGRPVWLSGGLNPDNVADAVVKVRPFGVDVAGGVEVPGNSRRKDAARVRAFITAAKAA